MKDIRYVLARGYESVHFHETHDLILAVTTAVAASLSTGDSIAVKRYVTREDGGKHHGQTVGLLRINPDTTDFRKAAPELVLATNAMAHDLCPNIHDLIQPQVQGDDQ